jgi:hypothetical protein
MSLSKRALRAAGILAVCALGVGCIGFRGPADVKRGVERRTASDLDREFAITVGPASMAFVRWAARVADEDDAAPLKGIRKVQVGVYSRDRDGEGVVLTRHLEPRDFPRYDPMVQVREQDERVLVLAESHRDGIRRMLVVVDDLDEVVIVRMSGDLERVIEEAIRVGLDGADREDLADPTIEALREERAATGGGDEGVEPEA